MINLEEKDKNLLCKYLPKYSELDGYIIFLIIILLYIFSPTFKTEIYQYLQELEIHKAHYVILPGLIFIFTITASLYYTFNFQKSSYVKNNSNKIKILIGFFIAIFICLISINIGLNLLNQNLNIQNTFYEIITNIIIAFNLVKSILTFIIMRIINITNIPMETFYKKTSSNPKQVIIASLVVFILFFIGFNSETNLVILSLNIFSITSIIAHLF